MSSKAASEGRSPYDSLEKILNKTTLTTQRVTHGSIVDVGDRLLLQSHVRGKAARDRAVADAIRAAELQHEQQLRAALRQYADDAELEKQQALAAQQERYEELALETAEKQKKAEEERINILNEQWKEELKAQLTAQHEEFSRQKETAVENSLRELENNLKTEFALAKEMAIAAALAKAREKFKVRELKTVKRVKCECEAAAEADRRAMQREHDTQLNQLHSQLELMTRQYSEEAVARQTVERDFKELQTDYKRFLDHSRGRFHSDYLMQLRPYGTQSSDDVPKTNRIRPLTSTTRSPSDRR